MNVSRTRRQISIIVGLSILIMALVAGVVVGGVLTPLLQTQNPVQHLAEFNGLFEWNLAGWWLIFVLDVLVAIGVYELYKEKYKSLSIWVSTLRVLYSVILAFAISYLMKISTNYQISPIPNRTVMEYLNSFQKIWSLGLILFGFHLILLSRAVDRGNWIENSIKQLLLIGGVGYVVVHSLEQLFPEFHEQNGWVESVFIVPMILGELGWGVWLLFKDGRLTS